MSDYRVNFGTMINTNDTTNLSYMLGIIGDEDELTITTDGKDASEVDQILRVLSANGFEYSTKGGHEDNMFHIFAKRKDGAE